METVKQRAAYLQPKIEVFLEAVTAQSSAEDFASETWGNDEKVVMKAIKQNNAAISYASEKIKNGNEFALEAIQQNVHLLSL